MLEMFVDSAQVKSFVSTRVYKLSVIDEYNYKIRTCLTIEMHD